MKTLKKIETDFLGQGPAETEQTGTFWNVISNGAKMQPWQNTAFVKETV